MTRQTLTCQHCTAATNGVVLCKRCQTTTEVALDNLAAYHANLFSLGTITQIRRRPSGPADPTGNAAGNVRVDDAVEVAAATTKTMLVGWTRVLIDDRPQLAWPSDTVAATTAFLRKHLATIAVLEWAGEMVRDVLAYEQRLRKIVSRGQGHWYAGICAGRTGEGVDDWCPRDLFVAPATTYLRCPSCGTWWSVAQRRAQVIEQARDALLPVAVIARAAVALLDDEPSQQKLEARLHKWVQRKQLEDYGVRVLVPGQKPRRVYRLGDVMDRLAQEHRAVV